jgi:Cu-processing system permease protein
MSVTREAMVIRNERPSVVWLVVRAVFLETIRRREFYVLLLFMGLFFLGTVTARITGIENAATATFLLNLGLTLAYYFALLLTILTAARQFPDEIENRTIYPLLAKPISRGQFLAGKWLASCLSGLICFAVLLVMAWLPTPKLEDFSMGTLAQMTILCAAGIGMAGALSMFLSLLFPKPLAVRVIVALALAGSRPCGWLQALGVSYSAEPLTLALTAIVPDFGKLDLVQLYTDGASPISIADFGLRVLHAVGMGLASLSLATWLVSRRQL